MTQQRQRMKRPVAIGALRTLAVFAAPLAALTLAPAAQAQGTAALELVPTNAAQTLGTYAALRISLSDSRPAKVTKLPEGIAVPRFGTLTFGPTDSEQRPLLFVLDESEGKDTRLFCDANGNGDFTDDAALSWSKTPYSAGGKDLIRYQGETTVPLGAADKTVQIKLYRFDPSDPSRQTLKDVLFYYRDYARKGTVTLGGKSYPAVLDDLQGKGDFRLPTSVLMVDLNGNGVFDRRGERFPINKPFNVAGTTYEIGEIAADGARLTIRPSTQTVAEVPPPPDLSIGRAALTFAAQTTDGKGITFPGTFKGKLVLLDFWATWCGPCRAELPHLTKAYEEFHNRGFEVLGISLDRENVAEKLAAFTRENAMPWPQVYDGKYWKAEVAQLYGVDSIPAAFLVDGDTGKVVASGRALRGEKLRETLAEALRSKQARAGTAGSPSVAQAVPVPVVR